MVKGYKSELDKYTTQIDEAILNLEAVLIDGAKEEAVIKPLFDELVKSMDNYTKGVKMIKQAYVSRKSLAIYVIYDIYIYIYIYILIIINIINYCFLP